MRLSSVVDWLKHLLTQKRSPVLLLHPLGRKIPYNIFGWTLVAQWYFSQEVSYASSCLCIWLCAYTGRHACSRLIVHFAPRSMYGQLITYATCIFKSLTTICKAFISSCLPRTRWSLLLSLFSKLTAVTCYLGLPVRNSTSHTYSSSLWYISFQISSLQHTVSDQESEGYVISV